jgi:hypothetical protein
MNKVVEVVLTALALIGLYCAVPQSVTPVDTHSVKSNQGVLIADGSDPMPLCRGKRCNNPN